MDSYLFQLAFAHAMISAKPKLDFYDAMNLVELEYQFFFWRKFTYGY